MDAPANSNPRLFLSHASVDKPFVNRLIVSLRDAGLPDPWYDVFELDGGTDDVAACLRLGVATADWFALVLSPASAESHWVSYEVSAASEAQKSALVLLHDSTDGHLAYLANPHLADFLRGGQRKVLNFTRDFPRALADLLLVIAPDVGRAYDAALTLTQIIDDADPDVAERAMSYAALYPDRFLPPLLSRLPDLRNGRKLRLRVEGALSAIGRPALEPLLEFVFQQREPEGRKELPRPEIAADSVEGDTEYFLGSSVTHLMRHLILSGGNQTWAGQIGASYGLVALARRDRTLRRSVVEDLELQLAHATNVVAAESARGQVTAALLDILRIAIDTLGLAAQTGEVNDFLVYQFATSKLWDWQSDTAKDKLGSYVVDCLSRSGSDKALNYLVDMTHDSEIVDLYFRISRSPNPWNTAFAAFGTRAVDPLLSLRSTVDVVVLPIAHLNLAHIRHPSAQRAAIEWADAATAADDLGAVYVLDAVARTGLTSACDSLLVHYVNGGFRGVRAGLFTDKLRAAVVVAARSASDRDRATQVCAGLIDAADSSLRAELARTIPAIRAYQYYGHVTEWLADPSPVVRASAAVSLSEHQVLKTPERLLEDLEYAEPDVLAPQLAVALSYFGNENAVAHLAHGLRVSLQRYDDVTHEIYATALARIGSDAARQVRRAWYHRI